MYPSGWTLLTLTLLAQGSCPLCTLVRLVTLLMTVTPLVWPVATIIWELAEN